MNGPLRVLALESQPLKSYADEFNMLDLPRISSEQHFLAALKDPYPHTYIMESMGMRNSRGEDGLGWFNAVDLHTALITDGSHGLCLAALTSAVQDDLANRQPVWLDIENVRSDTAFNYALEKIGYTKLPEHYQNILGQVFCNQRQTELTAETWR